jgi:membrane protein DedA with SNARE-associated domain
MALAYAWFGYWGGGSFIQGFGGSSYPVVFVTGILYSFGFTAPIAAGALLSLSPQINPFLAAIVGGLGSVLADFTIFRFVRVSFESELSQLRKTKAITRASLRFKKYTPEMLREYLLLALAGFFIASPLPDEIGISLLAGFTNIEEKRLLAVSFLLNTLGILVFIML